MNTDDTVNVPLAAAAHNLKHKNKKCLNIRLISLSAYEGIRYILTS